jgi:hypothetical protein
MSASEQSAAKLLLHKETPRCAQDDKTPYSKEHAMTVETLEYPQTVTSQPARKIRSAREPQPSCVEPNFGPEDMHAIKAIAYIMNGIFAGALVMYSTITFFAWLGS